MDSRPQAILKFRPPISLDYKARHRPQTVLVLTMTIVFCKEKSNSLVHKLQAEKSDLCLSFDPRLVDKELKAVMAEKSQACVTTFTIESW